MMACRILLIFLFISYLCSCSDYPIYKSYSKGRVVRGDFSLVESAHVVELDLAGIQTKSSVKTKVIDTLKVEYDSPFISLDSINVVSGRIEHENQSTTLILKLPYKKAIPKYFNSLDVNGNKIILFPTYRYSVSDEREGGGGIGFAYDNGYQRHNITRALHIAIYREAQLIYSNNAVRFEQIRTKKGESIKHEFPKEIADELLKRALNSYVDQMD